MATTSFLKRKSQMQRRPDANCHGGQGELDWTCVLHNEETKGRCLTFLHDDVLSPGVSIGVHRHERGEEYYYILSGRGEMTLDGRRYPVQAGDVGAVFPGGAHGLENNSEEDLRILVIGLQYATGRAAQ